MAGFTVSLTDYTEKATELLTSSVLLNDNLLTDYTLQSGIKYKEYLNFLDANPIAVAGACSLAGSGTTTLSEKTIEVATYAFRDNFCSLDLEKKALNLVPGTLTGLGSLEATMTDAQMAKIEEKLWYDRWFGRVASGNLINGWYYYANAASDKLVTTMSGASCSAITSSNIDDLVADFISKVSPDMWADVTPTTPLVLNMSVANYNKYKAYAITSFGALAISNFTQLGNLECWALGYEGQIKIKGIKAFDNSGVANSPMILTSTKNLVIGVDEVSEMSTAKWVEDVITDLIWFKANLKQGTQIKYTNRIVTNF